jgi:hypothetical protein
MSAYLRRKVDQQLGFCSDLQQVSGPPTLRKALRSALCLQLELALCSYLLELARASGNRRWLHNWNLDAGLLEEAMKAVPGTDLQELVDLSREADSWLASLLGGLRSIRRVDEASVLKAALFQSDFTEGSPGPSLIASSGDLSWQVPEWEDLLQITIAMRDLIQRQRLGYEEY